MHNGLTEIEVIYMNATLKTLCRIDLRLMLGLEGDQVCNREMYVKPAEYVCENVMKVWISISSIPQ